MARKKQEIALQREIETQEEWEECMAREGLWVVDVYQEWCGPCAALVGTFRRLKNELGDPLLNYAIAKCDTIDALERYRGRCEPTFLFYAGGILTSFIHGANAPKVQRVITEQLAQEHKVLEGTAERKEVKDPVITRLQEKEQEKLAEEEEAREAEEAKGVTVAIIKPDAVAQGKADEIINEMREAGIEILAEDKRQLTEEEAREMYSELENEDYFEDLIKFITSGPSHLLVLTRGETGETIIKDWRDMIGPTSVEQAQEEAPDSLRAKYGEKGYMNALHGSSSSDAAAKELAFFFPDLAIPTYLKKKENIQRTLAIIRPEAFSERKDEVLAKINEAGFKIAMYKEIQLTKEQAADFYKEHEEYAYFDQLVENMSSGPVLALGLARDEAISAWRDMLGPANVDEAKEQAPDSLRAQFVGPSGMNQLHGSDSEEAAKKEIQYFFPVEQTVAVIKPSGMGTKDAIVQKIHEAGFRIAAHKETTITQDIAELLYPHQKEKEHYDELVNSMTSGPTYFMVLSREDAVNGWRRQIGDTDPTVAKESNPESLRAQFGQDILNNAVHGSSDPERAKEEIRAVFGDLQFNPDGTIQGEEPQLDDVAQVIERDRAGDAAQDETTYDSTTYDTTYYDDTTVNETTNFTSGEQTRQETIAETQPTDETAEGDTTQFETTTGDETADETTFGDTTVQGEANATEGQPAGDQTEDQTVDQTTEPTTDQTTDQTAGEMSTVDETTAEETTADETAPTETEPSGEQTQEPEQTQQEESQGEQKPPTPVQQEEQQAPAAEEQTQQSEEAPAQAEEQKADATPAEGGDASASDATAGDAPAGDAPATDSAPAEESA